MTDDWVLGYTDKASQVAVVRHVRCLKHQSEAPRFATEEECLAHLVTITLENAHGQTM